MPLPYIFNNTAYNAGFFGTDDGRAASSFQIDDASTYSVFVSGQVRSPGDTVTLHYGADAPAGYANRSATLTATQYDNPNMIQFTSTDIPPGNTQAGNYRYVLSNTRLYGSNPPAGATRTRFTADDNTLGSWSGPSNTTPCYCTGTHLLTERGQVAVEDLAIGDLVVTVSGQHRPIRWIGSRAHPGLSAPQAERPVRIRAGGLSEGVPARDLLVSPDHCLWLDGLFVAAGHLVNGISITRGEPVADLTYWHVELDSHDLLVAEGAAAESFLAAPGVRAGFDGVQALDAGTRPVPYAPRAELGPELAALRGRLARRAISSGEATDLGPVRAWLDRCLVGADGLLHVGGWAQNTAQPDAPMCLDVMVDGAVVAFAVASEYRADLATAGIGDGRVGFDLGLDVRLVSGVPHIVEVRRSADGTLVCAKQIDAAGTWAALLAA
ncbi:MAG: Hint domain-containing protein [Rhodospirillales bacterium]|nr:Hint domain-containing protein [Acetobacter sp.]